MAFKLATRNLEDVTVIDLSGRLDIAQGSVVLREKLQSLPSDTKVLLNLTDVSFIDTCGLGELVSAHTRAQNNGGQLSLTGIPGRVEKLFEMTKLDRIFDIHDTETDALQSWGESSLPANPMLSESAA